MYHRENKATTSRTMMGGRWHTSKRDVLLRLRGDADVINLDCFVSAPEILHSTSNNHHLPLRPFTRQKKKPLITTMAIAPITGMLRKRFWVDISCALGLGTGLGYAYWYVPFFLALNTP
jgi:hypothetical protein